MGRATHLKPRYHKGMTFVPKVTGNKRKINSVLVQRYRDEYGHPSRIADKYFFRIYKHKGQQYTLYLGPKKVSHGGLRHRRTGKKRRTKSYTAVAALKYLNEKKEVENEVHNILRSYDKIKSGPHEGKYKHKKTGKIITERQLRVALARRHE